MPESSTSISKILVNSVVKEESTKTPDSSAFDLVIQIVESLPHPEININDFDYLKRIVNREP